MLDELEREIAARGYRRIHVSTGPRRPEARALYPAAGYAPPFAVREAPEEVGKHAFEKHL